jgi:hypothetical protein
LHGTSQGTPVPLSSFGGLATIADPNSIPEGASPRTQDTDYNVGSVFTRDGLTNAYTFANSSVGPQPGAAVVGPGWINPQNILKNDATFASIDFVRQTVGHTGPPITVTFFGFDIPTTASITGFQVEVSGFANAPATLNASLVFNGSTIGEMKTAPLGRSEEAIFLGALNDKWDENGAISNPLTIADLNTLTFGIQLSISSPFGLGSGFLDFVTITVGITTGAANFNFITTFTDQDGTVRNLSQDANGDLFVENVTANPGVLDLALSGITPNSFCTGANGEGVEYLSFSDLKTGSDIPRQFTSQWIDKISQVGPGASPIFSSSSNSATTFAITNIVQPVQKDFGFAFLLQSEGPGSNNPGNTVTVYYADSTLTGPDQDLINAANSGVAVYLFLTFTPSTGGDTVGALVSPTTALVTPFAAPSKPNGQSRPFFYFTYQVPTSGFVWNPGQNGAGVLYQRTLATLTTAVPVPQLTVGTQAVVTGNSVTQWNTTWPIQETFNSGAMAITQTTLSAAGVGTYSYTVISGANPVAGQLVTTTGLLNGNGALNVVNVAIATVSGTTSGTFTINLLPGGTSFPAQAESGQATTAGTLFGIDPGINTLGTSTSPIFGTGTGGSLTVVSPQVIGAGTRQGVCGFITRNGYFTAPSPPVIFDVPDNTTTINATQIPIGPPNTIARYISFTEAGQNGVPGGNFFIIPTPVFYFVNGVKLTASQTIIPDNTTTQASFTFIDSVLLNAEAIDVQGNNLFNLIEIGNPGWIVQYASRNFYGLCQNKVQNFLNMSFDGGFLTPSNPQPLGWFNADQFGALLVSPVFGNSYFITNSTGGGAGGIIGILTQSAFQDAFQQPIIEPNTTYSVRVTCRSVGNVTVGSLVVGLTSTGGATFAGTPFDMPLGQMTSEMATYTVSILPTGLGTVPPTLEVLLGLQNSGAGAGVEIDRIEFFPTEIPILTTTVFGSYANNFESVDAVTGPAVFNSENQDPCNNAFVLYDTLYVNKTLSKYSLKSSPNLEPSQWDITEVSQKAGSVGILSSDSGEQWEVSACRNGLYLYEGGQPGRIMTEIFQIWNSINWNFGNTIWVKNDVLNSRLFVGIPLPTPNFWLPNAPVNANPTTPNVILMCNYQGVASGEGIKSGEAVHVTMFGTLEAGDMRRKFSLWNIPSPYASFVQTAENQQFYICNGLGNSKIFKLDPNATTDDGMPINSLYTTYGFVNASKAAQLPALGWARKRWSYMTLTMENLATVACRFLADSLLGPTDSTAGYQTFTVPGGFGPMSPITRDRESTANFVATRTFLEFSGTNFDLSNVTLFGRKDVYNALRGQK